MSTVRAGNLNYEDLHRNFKLPDGKGGLLRSIVHTVDHTVLDFTTNTAWLAHDEGVQRA
jgi:hypothetical protein